MLRMGTRVYLYYYTIVHNTELSTHTNSLKYINVYNFASCRICPTVRRLMEL